MRKILLTLLLLSVNLLFSQLDKKAIWTKFPDGIKSISYLGSFNEQLYITYLNKENKLCIRTYSNDLSSSKEIIPNIPVLEKKWFNYQKTEIIDNKLTHFIAQLNKETSKIELNAYVQNSIDNPGTKKYHLAETKLNTRLWVASMANFTGFTIELSEDKSKLFVYPIDNYFSDVILHYDSSISVFNSNDLSTKIYNYTYLPKREYYTDNGIKLSNDGTIYKSDSYRLINKSETKVSQRRYSIRKIAKDTTNLEFTSETDPIYSLNFDKFDSEFYVIGTQFDKSNNKLRLFNNKYDANSLSLKDSLNIELQNNFLKNNLKQCDIVFYKKNSNDKLLFITKQYEYDNGGYTTHCNFTVYSLDINSKKATILCEIPIKNSLKYIEDTKHFSADLLKIDYINQTLYITCRDFTLNNKSLKYGEYSTIDDKKENYSTFVIKVSSDGVVSKHILFDESIQKKMVYFKFSKMISPDLIFIESKNNEIGILPIN